MMLSRAAPRINRSCIRCASTLPERLSHLGSTSPSQIVTASYQSRGHRKQQQLFRSILAVTFAAGGATLWQICINDGKLVRTAYAEEPASHSPTEEENPLIFERSRKQSGVTKEENRDLISSQHHQVKRSWENPGVYAWGSNAGRVVAPESNESVVKTPRRIAFFDGKLLRDIKLDRNLGAAIDERGNLLQWGTAYAADVTAPELTLKGKNLISLVLSRDRIIALAKNGSVYSIPAAKTEQEAGTKLLEGSWIPFWSSKSAISYRDLTPSKLNYGERIREIAGGAEHALLLSTTGRVFSAASASDSYPARGQLGVAGLSWLTRPEGAFDTPHELQTLRGFDVQSVAAGEYHSLALDKEGRLFAWGDNTAGQLGFESTSDSAVVDVPSLVPMQKLYSGTGQSGRITSISAGGQNTYFTVDATQLAPLPGTSASEDRKALRNVGKVTADTFALGSGLSGNLANNRWTHIQSTPAKIPSLSGLFEYDEKNNLAVPIRLSYLSVGDKHAAAVMENITYLDASAKSSDDDTNWGADIVFWGNNEHFQLGTGRRNNVCSPTYLQPLDVEAEERRAKKSSGAKEEHRFHITPRTTATLGDGRRVSIEQRVECGRGATCVYSKT